MGLLHDPVRLEYAISEGGDCIPVALEQVAAYPGVTVLASNIFADYPPPYTMEMVPWTEGSSQPILAGVLFTLHGGEEELQAWVRKKCQRIGFTRY